ncbi:Nn.00g097040.m01.CDS01 [Neocucurbitaria sp. VM-36]
MSIYKWLRRSREAPVINPEDNDTSSRFLELPGEIRNQIYFYAMYPDLESITIVNCERREHFGGTVLHLPLFRTCQQIRAEAISYLCATKNIKFLGIDTANAFFELIGETIANMKSMTLVQPASEITPLCRERIDRFFGSMAEAKALRKFRLEGVGKMISMEEGGEHWMFMKQVQDLREGTQVEIQLRFGQGGRSPRRRR